MASHSHRKVNQFNVLFLVKWNNGYKEMADILQVAIKNFIKGNW